MGLLIDDLVTQVLEQTRVVTNGPVLARHEPLRVDVIPGGGAGGQMTNDALSFVLGSTQAMEALRLSVKYELYREDANGDWVALDSSEFLRLPTSEDPAGKTLGELLSLVFIVKPKLKLKPGSGDPLDVDVALPELDHELRVTLTVEGTATADEKLERVVKVPFTVPTVEFGLPIPGAVCICSAHANLDTSAPGKKFLIMLPPGSPSSIPQIVASYNEVLDTLNGLEPVLGAIAAVVKPLQKVVDTLKAIPTPYITTDQWVKDFDLFDSFDDEMSSFLLVGPTGWGVQFSDTANMGDWDDVGGYGLKTYKTIDVLKLPDSTVGAYVMNKLGIAPDAITEVNTKLVEITGLAPGDITLGIGVMFVHDLADSNVELSLRKYDTIPDDDIDSDTESARWSYS